MTTNAWTAPDKTQGAVRPPGNTGDAKVPSHIIGDLEIMTEAFGTADALTLVAIYMRCRSWLVSSCAKSLAWSNTNEGGRISSSFPPRWQVHEDLDLTGTGLVHWTCFSS